MDFFIPGLQIKLQKNVLFIIVLKNQESCKANKQTE